MTEGTTDEIRKCASINGSLEIAFRALTDESELTQWFSNDRTVLEPQVGEAWMVKNYQSYTGKIHTIRGRYCK